jgi:hypothetical protein
VANSLKALPVLEKLDLGYSMGVIGDQGVVMYATKGA